jgi:co-chaperonin GroES (HSP10)
MKVFRDYVLVEPIAKETMVGGIFVGEGIDKSLRAKVVKLGKDVQEIELDDLVVYYDGLGLKINENGKDYVILKEGEISVAL